MRMGRIVIGIIAPVAGVWCASSGLAQAPPAEPVRIPRGRVPAAERQMRAALQLIELYLRNGQRTPYRAEQTTRLLDGRMFESRQVILRAGQGRERIEYLEPPQLRGEVMLQAGGRFFHYRPRPRPLVLEGVPPVEEWLARGRELRMGVLSGLVRLRVAGRDVVAGQDSAIVEVRSARGGGCKRLWIDLKTGVRLRQDTVNPRGDVTSTAYLTSIDYAPRFSPRDFRPDRLPVGRREAVMPTSPPLSSVEVAQRQVQYAIREPVMPVGYAVTGVWVLGVSPAQTVVIRYSDGVNTVALVQRPAASRMPTARTSVGGAATMRGGSAHWVGSGRLFTLLGPLSPRDARAAINSLQ